MLTPKQVVAICYKEKFLSYIRMNNLPVAKEKWGWLQWLRHFRSPDMGFVKVKPEWHRLP